MRMIDLGYTPTKKQRLFHAAGADEVLYGGAAGGGKSKAVVMEALVRGLTHAGTQAYLFRRTYRELEDTLIGEALASIPKELGTYKSSTHDFHLINGSVLRFRHCQREADRFAYQGAEMHVLFIDELTHFTKEMYDYLKTRLRAKKTLGLHPVVRATANPGGVGHAWVKAYFVDAGLAGQPHKREVFSPLLGKEQTRSVMYLPATAMDNPHIDDGYLFELEQKPKALRDALLLGNWDAFEGQAFPEFVCAGEHSHVILPIELPKKWRRYRSFDFGYSKPFSVGWWAISGDGVAYRYREWYGSSGGNVGLKMTPTQIAHGILQKEQAAGEEDVLGIADPSIWDSSRGDCIAMQMQAAGVYFSPGDNARLAGKMQLHRRLAKDANGQAGLYVFENCRDFIRTLPSLCYDTAHVEDVDTAGEDHIYDEVRYFLMEHPLPESGAKAGRAKFDPLQ